MANSSGFIALLVLLCIYTVHAMPGCNGGDTQSKYLKHVIKELGLEPSDIMSVIRPGGTGPHSGCAVDIKGFLGKRVHIDEPAESLVVTVGQILNSLPGTLKTTKTIGGKQVDTFEHLCYEIGFPRKKDKCKIPNSETNECLDLAGDVFFPAYCNDNGFGGAHQPVRVGRLLTTMSNRSKEQVASSINTLINKGGAIHNMFPDGPDHLHIEVRPTNKFPGGCRMDFSDTRLLSGCGRAVKGEKDKEEDIKKRNACMDNCAAQFAKAVADGPKTPKKLQFCFTLTVPTEDPENPDAGGFFVKSRSTSPVDPAPPGLKPFCFFGVDLPRMREVSPAVNGVAKEVTVTSYGAADAPAPAVQKCNKQFVIPEHLNPQCVDLNKCENCSFNNNGDNPQANCIRGACPGPKNIVCCFNAKMK